MRSSEGIAIAASGVALAVMATLPATADTAQHSSGTLKSFPSTITPRTVSVGQTLTLTGHGARKNTKYVCVFVIAKGPSVVYDLLNWKMVRSTSTGNVTCKRKFKAYSMQVDSRTRHCPLTKADRRSGFRCGVAVVRADKSSRSVAYFHARRK
jgi:hypothetical protein